MHTASPYFCRCRPGRCEGLCPAPLRRPAAAHPSHVRACVRGAPLPLPPADALRPCRSSLPAVSGAMQNGAAKAAFTNVFREDDPTTKAVIALLDRCDSPEDAAVTAAMSRLVNKTQTLRAIGPLRAGVLSDAEVARIAAKMAEHGFGAAYRIPPMGTKGEANPPKVAAKIAEIAAAVALHPQRLRQGSEALFKFFLSFKYVGPFLAYQMCVDDAHVIAGPGALMGLGWLWPKNKNTPNARPTVAQVNRDWKPALVTEAIRYLRDSAPPELLEVFNGRHWTLMSVENCLCEGDKYLRMHHKVGGTKRKRNYA
eukprot:gene25663-49783_t